MKYKIGDRVKIKSLDWYNKNKGKDGNIVFSSKVPRFSWCENIRTVFTKDMVKFCGKVVTIENVWAVNYSIVEGTYKDYFTDEMIEGLVEEKTKPKFKIGDIVYSTTWQRDVIIQDILPDGFYKVGDIHNLGWFITDESCLRKEKNTLPIDSQLLKQKISLPEGYQFVDENGNVINATKIVLEKKKKEYPKTYEECCSILGFDEFLYSNTPVNFWYKWKLFHALNMLIVCRDAYWKIAGDEMGLGKPWEPDWNTSEPKYVIAYTSLGIEKQWETTYCKSFAFPTEKMRDNFFTNFKKLIESVKELL